MRIARQAVVATAALSVGLLAGCGAGGDSGAPGGGKLPDPTAQNGTIRFAADFTQPPGNFREKNQQTGVDYELCNAAAEKLGRKVEWVDIKFSSLIPGLQAGQFDAICGSMVIKPERTQQVNFVINRQAGNGAGVAKGNPKKITSRQNLCGVNVALLLGSVYEKVVQETSDSCVKSGKSAIEVKTFSTVADAWAQLRNGRADAVLGDDPIVSYYVNGAQGALEIAYEGDSPAPYGLAVAKKSTGLAGALIGALYELKNNGEYEKALAKWHLEKGAVDSF